MQERRFIILVVLLAAVLPTCGGEKPPPKAPAEEPAETAETPPDPDAHPLCERPIQSPEEVWPRIETVRKLSDEEFQAHCGLDLIEIISYWRCPPVDLLGRVVSEAAKDQEALASWVKGKVENDSKLARRVVAMDIIGRWQLGADVAAVAAQADRWKANANGHDRIVAVAEAAEALEEMLPKVTRVHELRCMLEVNPLGFAVECKPIHKPHQKIDLNWQAKVRDGLLEDLELSRCTGSPACKKLKKHAVELKDLYLSLMREVEQIRVDVYQEQLKSWLKLRPFN